MEELSAACSYCGSVYKERIHRCPYCGANRTKRPTIEEYGAGLDRSFGPTTIKKLDARLGLPERRLPE